MDWSDLQPKFRMTVLRERAQGKTMDELAEEVGTARSQLYRMIANEVDRPCGAVMRAAERYVADHPSHLGRSEEGDPSD